MDLGGKWSTRFRRENGPVGSSSEWWVLGGNFLELILAWRRLPGWLAAPMTASLSPMAVEHLFTQALGLASPWKVVSCNFDPAAKSLELVIIFQRGARFPGPESGEPC